MGYTPIPYARARACVCVCALFLIADENVQKSLKGVVTYVTPDNTCNMQIKETINQERLSKLNSILSYGLLSTRMSSSLSTVWVETPETIRCDNTVQCRQSTDRYVPRSVSSSSIIYTFAHVFVCLSVTNPGCPLRNHALFKQRGPQL